MAQIKSEEAYEAAMKRIEELEELVDDDTPANDSNALELDMLIDMVEEYEEIHYPIGKPSLVDIMKLRMYEMGLTQKKMSEMLQISASTLSELISGKREPTFQLARTISTQLNIDPAVVLGV